MGRARRARKIAATAAYGGGGLAAASAALGAVGYAVIKGEALLARRIVGTPFDSSPDDDGTYGAGPGERVRRRGGDIFVGESISYGMADADAVVRQLIVDDGVPGRGHRILLFKNDFRFAGVGCSGHRRYGHMCVVDLAANRDGAPALPQWASTRTPARARAR